jgi:hypothetical protein
MNVRMRVAVGSLAAAALLGACGGDDDEPSSGGEAAAEETSAEETTTEAAADDADEPAGGGELAACDLITADEAEEAIGKPVELDDQGSNSTFSVCTYQSEAGDNFILSVAFGAGSAAYESSVDALPAATGSKPEEVSGLGDQAVFVATGSGAAAKSGAVYALVGEDYLNLSYSGDQDPEEVTTEAAGIAAGRL